MYTGLSATSRATASVILLISGLLIAACASNEEYNPLDDFEEVQPANSLSAPTAEGVNQASIDHGRYLVELMGCGSCHTHGAINGKPDLDLVLAGSAIGIAFSNPLAEKRPGVVFPPNLTPDEETGLGGWTTEDIVSAMRHGVGADGKRLMSVMPWPAYIRLSDSDAHDIAAYLLSLPPVRHRVPGNVEAGTKSAHPYVYFGVYRGRES